jgi:glycolate oxidase FAD binding subunit
MSGGPAVSRNLPWDELAARVSLRSAAGDDVVLGRAPEQVAEPRTAQEVAASVKWANEHGAAVAPRGGGTKMEWGKALGSLDLLLSTRPMNRVLEHAWEDLTVTVEPGCTVADLQRALGQHGQRLAIDPLFPERATIGGMLATNDNGSLRTRFGSLRDLIIGITVALPDGTLARSGGKVVKNVAGYDLPKLFTGSLGTLGVITEATFRLHPLPSQSRTYSFHCDSVADANSSLLAMQDSTLAHTGLQLRTTTEGRVFLDVRFEGLAAGIESQAGRAVTLIKGRKVAADASVWRAGEELWSEGGKPCIGRVSLLPSQIAEVCARIDALASISQVEWRLVLQAVGVGFLHLQGDPQQLVNLISKTREDLQRTGGSLVLLRASDEVRSCIDVWGSAGSALPLMRRMKEQFDPGGILNPGRYVGGI